MKLKSRLYIWFIPFLIGIIGYSLLHFCIGSSRSREKQEQMDATEALMQKIIDVKEHEGTGHVQNRAQKFGRTDQGGFGSRKQEAKEASQQPSDSSARSVKTGKRSLVTDETTSARRNAPVIRESAIAVGVENREPKGVCQRISVRDKRVYCWIHVVNGEGEKITIRWVSKGKRFAEKRLLIRGNDWRTWTYTALRPGTVGPAQADILTNDGQLLQTLRFEIAS